MAPKPKPSSSAGKIKIPAPPASSSSGGKKSKKAPVPSPKIDVLPDSGEDEATDEEDELSPPPKSSVKGKGKARAFPPFSRVTASDLSMRDKLAVSRLIMPEPPVPEISLNVLKQRVADDEARVELMMKHQAEIEAPGWRPALVAPIPPFVRPSEAPPPDFSNAPAIPDAPPPCPAQLPPDADLTLQLERNQEIGDWTAKFQPKLVERSAAIHQLVAYKANVKAAQEKAFWLAVDREETQHGTRLKAWDAEVKCGSGWKSPLISARIQMVYLCADQIQCGLRYLVRLKEEMATVHKFVRGLGYQYSCSKHLDLVLDAIHVNDIPPHMKFVAVENHPLETDDDSPISRKRARSPSPPPDKQPIDASASQRPGPPYNGYPFNPDNIDEKSRSFSTLMKGLRASFFNGQLQAGPGCTRCRRLGPCVTPLEPRSRGGKVACLWCKYGGKACTGSNGKFHGDTSCFLLYWNTFEAALPDAAVVAKASPRKRAKIKRIVSPPAEPEEKGKEKEDNNGLFTPPPLRFDPLGPQLVETVMKYTPDVSYSLEDLVPLDATKLVRIPPQSAVGKIMQFAIPPKECSDEERARRLAARNAYVERLTVFYRCLNLHLAGPDFVLKLAETTDPLRYAPGQDLGPTPPLHSPAYPVEFPELRSDTQWQALAGAFDDFEGERAADLYRFITRDEVSMDSIHPPLFFVPHSPTPEVPIVAGGDIIALAEESAPHVEDPRAQFFLGEAGPSLAARLKAPRRPEFVEGSSRSGAAAYFPPASPSMRFGNAGLGSTGATKDFPIREVEMEDLASQPPVVAAPDPSLVKPEPTEPRVPSREQSTVRSDNRDVVYGANGRERSLAQDFSTQMVSTGRLESVREEGEIEEGGEGEELGLGNDMDVDDVPPSVSS
ncbi:hypothetical protein B0H19DRAFT_1245738 [Mycena capillaripes]|nr:hypothetical protein B0H19DRAFT_1245738 [Mycena capillaripes]